MKRIKLNLVTISGEPIKCYGTTEFVVTDIGPVEFTVVDDISHECIIGWDVLRHYGFELSNSHLYWGSAYYDLVPGVSDHHVMEVTDLPLEMSAVLDRYHKLFQLGDKLAAAKLPPLRIITEGPPVRQRAYRAPLTKRILIEQELERMLKLGVIQPSSSPYASPVTLVPKPDGSVRFCCDYRRLNNTTKKDAYPPALSGAKAFSLIDMANSYWQMPIHRDSI